MSLTGVKMSEEVWLTCVTHALSTETEEIMGLLLGDIQYSKNGSVTALIWGASPQTRSDRRKDRVETNPEQLAAASAQAEIMTSSTGTTTRVIDVRTQGMYQLLDSGFIGLIFSCFSEDANKVGRIQVIAFQSMDGKQDNFPRPISLSPVHRNSIIDVESSLSSSENTSSRFASLNHYLEQDTGDSRTSIKGAGRSSELGIILATADANYPGRDGMGGSYHAGSLHTPIVDMDPMDMSESMQEAMHRSNLDMSGAEYVRKEAPLHICPTLSLLKLDSPLSSYIDLQRVIHDEERAAYNQAILQNMSNGKMHPLTFIHHTSTYQASMCKLMEYCLSPAISALHDRLRENEIRSGMLTEEAKLLEAEALRHSESSSASPRSLSSRGNRGSVSLGQRESRVSSEYSTARTAMGSGSRSRKDI